MKPKVFITRRLPDAALEMIQPVCEVEVWPEEMPTPREVLLAKAAALDGLLSMLTDTIDAELMERAPGLKVISNYAVGVDNIDIPEATRRGLIIGHTPGVLTETTADLAFGLLMAAARRIVEGDRYVRAGQWRTWSPMILLGRDLHGATLGLVGLGRIGTAVARRAAGFGMRVLYHSRTRQPDAEEQLGLIWADLDTVLREADFISLHTPLTPETRHLINARTLGLMKNSAILVNTARGGVVDQAALFAALQEGKIAGAALDVTDPEPLPMSDPLLTLPNCVIAPHIGSASIATRTKMAEMAAANLLAGLKGEMPPHPVNPEAWQKG